MCNFFKYKIFCFAVIFNLPSKWLYCYYSEENKDKCVCVFRFVLFCFKAYLWDGGKFLPVNQSVLEAANQAPGDGLCSGRENCLRDVKGTTWGPLTQSGLQEED